MARRRQWLVAEGLAEKQDGGFTYRRGMIAALQRRELSRVAGQLSEELAKPFVEPGLNERIAGRFTRTVDRSEEHTSELQSLMRISYAVFSLNKKTPTQQHNKH